MNAATSLRGQQFQENFIEGFQQNEHRRFSYVSNIVVRSTESNQTAGDVDFFVKVPTDMAAIRLKDLMPQGSFLHDVDFILQAEDNIFFELATQQGNNIHVARGTEPSYIEKKIEFHAKIRRLETDFRYLDGSATPTGRSVIILVFNGADSARVKPHFQGCLARHGDLLVGSSVFASSDLISQWKLSCQLLESQAASAAAENRAEREQDLLLKQNWQD